MRPEKEAPFFQTERRRDAEGKKKPLETKNRKRTRQEKILRIVAAEAIETQEQLLAALRKSGIVCTQATISRDIRELSLRKDTAGYYHAVREREETGGGALEKLDTIFREAILSVDFTQNLVVLKTMPGLANAACSALDCQNLPAIVGTIAGDDTAFLAMRDRDAAAAFCQEIRKMLD